MTNININDLANLAKSMLNSKQNGKDFVLNNVCNIVRNAYEQHPEDTVIAQVSFTLEKMAEKAPVGATISQVQVSDIYNNFVRMSGNSKFRSVLGFLLPDDIQNCNHNNINSGRVNEEISEDFGDNTNKQLVAALGVMFGDSVDSIKSFDERLAKEGTKYVVSELVALGFKKPSVKVMGGNNNTLIYTADFDTRNGVVTVPIPIEVSSGNLLFPSTFVADDHLEELKATKLSYFIDRKRELNDFSVPKISDVLTAVGILTGNIKNTSGSEFDKISNQFVEQDYIPVETSNLFIDRKYEDGPTEIDTTQNVEMPKELAHLARDFENDVLEAASGFGLIAIRNGKEIVARELESAGFKNAQVKFGSESGDSVVYLASINTPKGAVEIEVPVEMQSVRDKYVPLQPSYFAYDGIIEDFTPTKLQRFTISPPVRSNQNTVYSSTFSYMVLPEIKDEIFKAATRGDYVTCEIALDEIANKFSEEDHRNAVVDFQHILMEINNLKQKEATVHTCDKVISAGKGSIYARCGHFGVPLHEVIVDEYGHCQLKRNIEKNKQNPVEEGGAAISSAKIFMS